LANTQFYLKAFAVLRRDIVSYKRYDLLMEENCDYQRESHRAFIIKN